VRRQATLPAEPVPSQGPEGPRDPIALVASPGAAPGALAETLAPITGPAVAEFVRRLEWHRVDGLAWRTLAALPPEGIDPWLRATLRRRHQLIAAATLAQGLALGEVLDAIARAGIPAAVMRGLRVVEWIYGDAGARRFEDHDLLVRPEDAAGVAAILARSGFTEAARGLWRRASVDIDLHTDPIGAGRRPSRARLFPIDTAALFRDARPGWVAGGPVLLLRDEDDALLLALHVVKHSFDRLARTADLAHLVAVHGRSLSWERLGERARSLRAGRLVALAFAAAETLGSPLPEALRPATPPGPLESLLLRRVAALAPLPYGGEILMALTAPRLRDRVRFVLDALLPGGEAPGGRWQPADVPRRAVTLVDGAVRSHLERGRSR
jgi:putative nucleotidyltransferase-like protein